MKTAASVFGRRRPAAHEHCSAGQLPNPGGLMKAINYHQSIPGSAFTSAAFVSRSPTVNEMTPNASEAIQKCQLERHRSRP